MSKAVFNCVKITGISTVVPEKEINIYDEAQYYDNNIKKIDRMRKMVGFYKRRVSEITTNPSDLAIFAAQNLIQELNIDKSSIDALIYVVQQPDVISPATAYYIHDKLGLSPECIATDINQGCPGWVWGLYLVSSLIQSGVHKKVLLLNASTPSVGTDITNRNIAPIFGDAGTATLIEYSEEPINSYFAVKTFGSGFESIIFPFSGTRFRMDYNNDEDFELLSKLRKEKLTLANGYESRLLYNYLNGAEVFDFTIKKVPENIIEVLNFANMKQEDIDVLCLHQANKQIVQAVAQAAGFDETDEIKVPYKAFENYGNNTMCSIPTTLALLDDNTPRNKILCSAFGNGFASASAVLNLQNTRILKLKDYKVSEIHSNDEENTAEDFQESSQNSDRIKLKKYRENYINYWRRKMKGEINE